MNGSLAFLPTYVYRILDFSVERRGKKPACKFELTVQKIYLRDRNREELERKYMKNDSLFSSPS